MAATAGLLKAGLFGLTGLVLLLVGAVLTFRAPLVLGLDGLYVASRGLMGEFIPKKALDDAVWATGGVLLFLGMYVFVVPGLRAGFRHLIETIAPGTKAGIVDVYRQRQTLAQGPRIVAIGGGTGLSTILRGLKAKSSNITAIVTVSDDGGSSGRLIKDKGMIPPGDIRNCLVALADAEKSMTDLFQHRFKDDSGSLSGHALGNLLIAALVDQSRGDFEKAVERASDVLNIRGRVVPSTLDRVRLRALLDSGAEICGETAIVEARGKIRRIFLDPANVTPHHAALEAIADADVICIGPGSVFTSIIPNLLVPGVTQALKETQAVKVYICNVMTQPGESDSFTASEHVSAILTNTESRIFDYVLVNNGIPSEIALSKYRESGQFLVEADLDRIRGAGFRPIVRDFTSETDFVRHDSFKVAECIMGLLR
ncbi:MAG TPA: gluconeogenesis factor YvcK family protein [Fimbriimonadaceae bacterium]|nr:gluconeogenesis factor YvcK family protein [Fimbriimonadaceae bacterium]